MFLSNLSADKNSLTKAKPGFNSPVSGMSSQVRELEEEPEQNSMPCNGGMQAMNSIPNLGMLLKPEVEHHEFGKTFEKDDDEELNIEVASP